MAEGGAGHQGESCALWYEGYEVKAGVGEKFLNHIGLHSGLWRCFGREQSIDGIGAAKFNSDLQQFFRHLEFVCAMNERARLVSRYIDRVDPLTSARRSSQPKFYPIDR